MYFQLNIRAQYIMSLVAVSCFPLSPIGERSRVIKDEALLDRAFAEESFLKVRIDRAVFFHKSIAYVASSSDFRLFFEQACSPR